MRKYLISTLFLCALLTIVPTLSGAAQKPFFHLCGKDFKRNQSRMEAEFKLDNVPDKSVFLFLKARNIQNPLNCSIEIKLNGKSLYKGLNSFLSDFWGIKRYPIPTGVLKTGPNRLALSNLEKKGSASKSAGFMIAECFIADCRFTPPYDLMTDYSVELPSKATLFPEPLPAYKTEPGFELRGTKGWAWAPEQYLDEIPYLRKYKMNFLMNCYASMFTDPEKFINRWWEPIPESKKKAYEKVVRSCQENGIIFCFAIHPQLFSARPFKYESEEDFESLWQHYAWMQGLGVKWFSLSYDDIPVEGQDISFLGEAHAKLVNKLLARLREKDPEANLIFCPVYYWGCGDKGGAKSYLKSLARVIDEDIFIFWTGDGVVTTTITRQCAEAYKSIVKRRLIIWDNYPVNDRTPALHLGPITGRDPGLTEIAYGYMSNPLSPQNEINRIPLLTCADFAYNPENYDPVRSIGQAIIHLASTPGQRRVLKDLVELYPGNLTYCKTQTSFNCVLERFNLILQEPDGRPLAERFIAHVEDVLNRLNTEFPDAYKNTKKTINLHLTQMKEKLR
jgi:hypothetical protein